MKISEWRQVLDNLPADTPVIFCLTAQNGLLPGEYCDGQRVFPSRIWEGAEGWKPCVMVELGEKF